MRRFQAGNKNEQARTGMQQRMHHALGSTHMNDTPLDLCQTLFA
jgi:hypothetical protein